MEEDEGMESFEVDDKDLEYAMNPGRRQYQTRNQATYGIWADKDSDDEEGEFKIGFGGADKKRAKNLTTPVNFISGGIKQGSSLDPKEEKDSEAPEEDNIQVNPFSLPPKRPKMQKNVKGANVFAGMRTSSVRATVDPNEFAGWAKHGKGEVIMNMMRAMGYKEGEGLGKDSKGIVEPVQAAARPGRAAVGAYGKEATGPKFGESAADAQKRSADKREDEEEEENTKGVRPLPKGAWRKSARVKTQYKTIDDVIKEGGSIGHRTAQISGVKVIDMTGPEQRVYTGYDALSLKTLHANEDAKAEGVFDIPELTHNVNLLLDLTEEDIRRTNHQLKTIEDESTALRYDLRLVREELVKEEEEFQRMQEVYDLLEKLNEKGETMEVYMEVFRLLKTKYAAEFALFELDKVAIPSVLPLIKKHFESWRPLEESQQEYGISLMEEWAEILQPAEETRAAFTAMAINGKGSLVDDRLSAFDRLMWDGWMPPIRTAVLQWDPREDVHTMLKLLEKWFPLMAAWMREKIIELLIIPRLTARVESWDPLSDPLPVHSWLVPWLEILGDHLLPVFSPIRQKLAKALRNWHPKDNSALLILRPWKEVWAPGTMASFLGQNIVPRMKEALQDMDLDPAPNKKYEEFNAALEWLELISTDAIADALITSFFPKWYDTLLFWLDSPCVVMSEVKSWLAEWNARFPPVLMQHPGVKECLLRGLLALAGQRPTPVPAPQLLQAPPPPPRPTTSRPDELRSLKVALEMTAAERNITFVPQQNRLKEGKQVYWFGTVSMYIDIDRKAVYALDTKSFEWMPISVEQLLDIA